MGAGFRPDSTPGIPGAEEICEWLRKIRFRKVLFGGVDEADVWKKLAELEVLYETALKAERFRYDTLLAERDRQDGETAGRTLSPVRTPVPEPPAPGEG